MIKRISWKTVAIGLISGVVAAYLLFAGNANFTAKTANKTQTQLDAEAIYVPPGQKDDYYLMASGGHSGQLFVYGLPSMRLIRTVPVFSPDTATGYGFDDASKAMLAGYTWGDFHHPSISETDGVYDGRALFATDNANNRVAFVDLQTFTTKDILKIPNVAGPHCGAFITPNSEYLFLPTRFSVPLDFKYTSLDEFDTKYKGIMTAVKPDFEKKKLNIAYQVMLPPWSYDLSDSGKAGSNGWGFLSTYNSEEATTTLEINASQNDRDYIVMFNWKKIAQEVQDGHFKVVDGIKMFDPVKYPGSVFLVGAAKSPHGVDVTPDGKYFVASGKLSPTVTVFSFEKAMQAIKNKDFSSENHGLPVLKYEDVMEKQVEVGLGPLHTQFDGDGNAYTTLFIDSQIVKWNIATGKIIDKTAVSYAPGHLAIAGGDTVKPDGKWLVSLNKISKDSFLPVGPSHPESFQLIDISGEKMHLVASSPDNPEPHYAQIIKADKIHTINVYPKDENNPDAIYEKGKAHIVRKDGVVDVYGVAFRSRYVFDAVAKRPDVIEVNQGDKVKIHLTNIDRDEDITHGFGINDYNINMEIQPGETKNITFTADKPGVYPIYCTNFCSALHQEMTGYLLVKPK